MLDVCLGTHSVPGTKLLFQIRLTTAKYKSCNIDYEKALRCIKDVKQILEVTTKNVKME